MAKCKYDFSKEELERLYNEYESFSLAGRKLGVSKNTFRQQYLKSQGLCMVCSDRIPEGHFDYTCEVCLERNRAKANPPIRQCASCTNIMERKEGQSKLSWTKQEDCKECKKSKCKTSSKKTYMKFRGEYTEKVRLNPKTKDYQRNYRNSEEGKLKRRVSNAKRRAAKVTTASPTISSYIQSLFTSPTKSCPYCPSTEKLSIDHILPLSRGGTHTEDNVELACLECNIRKGNKTKEEFIEFLNIIKE